jgi:hypothetical protein
MFLLLAFAAGVPSTAQEQRRHFGSRGTIEVGGSITFLASQPVVNEKRGVATSTLSVLPYVGYFVIESFEVGINPAGLVLTSVDSGTTTQLRILVAPSYNFRTGTMITPFVEGLAGLTSETVSISGAGTSTSAGFTWGGRAGVKVALLERGLLIIGLQYLNVTVNPPGTTTRNGSNEFSVAAGWTVWF